MKLTFNIDIEDGEKICSFDLAKAFYNICVGSDLNVLTVANMMLLEVNTQTKEMEV